MRLPTLAGNRTFAHLIGLGAPAAGKRAEDKDDERDQRDDESDEDYAKRMEELDEEDDGDDEGDDGEDGKGDDDSDGAEMRNAKTANIRLRERARCAAIFSDKAAASNPALAATLAFGTDLPRSKAVAVLRAGGTPAAVTPKGKTLDERMAGVKVPTVGASSPERGAATTADLVTAAYNKARGIKD